MKKLIILLLLACAGSGFGQTITHSIDYSKLHDDVAGVMSMGGPYNPFSRYIFTTDATTIDVVAQHYPSLVGDGSSAFIGVKINGVMQTPLNYNDGTAESSRTVTLGAGTKTVELINGPKTGPYGSWYSTFVRQVIYPAGSSFSVTNPVTETDRVAILGNSITSGWGSTQWVTNNFVQRLRDIYGIPVIADAYACRSMKWFTDGATGLETPAEQMNNLLAADASVYIIVFGTNDYGYEPAAQPSVTFGSDYAAVLDTIHARKPNARIVCVTMFKRANEGPMGHTSENLEAFRTQIVNAVAGRSYVTLLRGENWATYNTTNFPDGVHPSDGVHAIIADSLAANLDAAPLNQQPTVTASADDVTISTGATVQLSSSASDGDGSIASYAWSIVSGTGVSIASASTQNTTATFSTAGTKVLRVTVTDNEGATGFDDITITVSQVFTPTEGKVILHTSGNVSAGRNGNVKLERD